MKITEGTISIGALIAFTAWLLIGLPWLYSPLERVQYYEATQKAPDKSNAQPNGAPQSPFFVQVIPTPKSADERTQEAEERQEKRAIDRRLSNWTVVLGASTIGLMVLTGILGFFAFRQSRDTRNQIKLARDEFISTHRPKLILRQAYAPIVKGASGPITVQLVISNIGESDAWIIESIAYLEMIKTDSDKLLLTPDSIGIHDLTTLQPRFRAGQETKFFLLDKRSNLVWDDETKMEWIYPFGLFLVGRYVYIDEAKIRRQTAFRRWYDRRAQRFIKVFESGTEHEYAD